MDLDNKDYYVNRELSWLMFNERVLEEAYDKTNPLLERFKFLAITASNLDEFFMVRVSGLLDKVDVGYNKKDIAGLTPSEQLEKISEKAHEMYAKQNSCLMRSLLPALEKEGVRFLKPKELSKEQIKFLKEYFDSTLYPILTPMAIDQSRPFPLLPNKSLNLIMQIIKDDEKVYAIMQVPTVVSRVTELPSSSDSREFIMLEDIISMFVENLFEGCDVKSLSYFRITRNSDLTIDEEDTDDLLSEIEKSIKKRKWGDPVRLEIEKNMDKEIKDFLLAMLDLDGGDIYESTGYIDFTVWSKFSSIKGFDHLRDEVLSPQPVPEFLDKNIFEAIKENDILVHHPYESFDCVVKYVQEASKDPNVLAIKQTLYRVSGNSPIVGALIQAAENGKQVTVLVELKARFDEENNIIWAKKLEKAGCHVIYGLVGLKTHCKICLVVRQEEDGIKRYVHMATGNYNDSTAKLYTDYGFFTAKESFGTDVSALFNVLTGYSKPPQWKKISVAPTSLRQTFLQWIENETNIAKQGRYAEITAKMNSLVDKEMIDALYNASMAGVKINLIVRGICCLKSGIKGVSENIRVISIVDRFLEHSRIYYFHDDGNEKIFLSSADLMPRNLDKRVETAFPIEEESLKERIKETLKITLSDTVKARVQKPDGTYERIDRRGKESIHSQLIFHKQATENYKKAKKHIDSEMFRPLESNMD
ncbi:MAG: RNA degradosome polyphosphate kinase [Tyzzerella sp.]|uniref:Polyphosphate kinase n=1 Tax=Candidatus Fimicola merdigallinarum TaxID=2840819 RepID=A0A9D9DZQ9_9FIRM|nr:RNA degradosome polyphosphate kinase [Candidatus Fimicola merdigallinarum]